MKRKTPKKKTARKSAKKKPGNPRGGPQTPAGALVEKAVGECPDVPSLRLGRNLYTRHPELFKSVEQVRRLVRYYRGQCGDRDRGQRERKGGGSLFRESGIAEDGTDIFDLIPDPIESLSDWKPVKLKGKRLLVFSDVHIPFHSKEAIRTMLEYAQDREIDSVLLNGDIIDFYSISRWEKDPRLRDLAREVNDTIQFLSMLRKIFPSPIPIYYKQGNHEDRYISYLIKKAPELLGMAQFDFDEVMCFDELQIQHIDSRNYATFGLLPIIHGHEFGRSFTSPVNPARGLFLRAKESCLGAHYHRSSSHSERRMQGHDDTTFSIGCLCNLNPDYQPLNNWNHGFAEVEIVGKGGHFQVHNKKILGGGVFSG